MTLRITYRSPLNSCLDCSSSWQNSTTIFRSWSSMLAMVAATTIIITYNGVDERPVTVRATTAVTSPHPPAAPRSPPPTHHRRRSKAGAAAAAAAAITQNKPCDAVVQPHHVKTMTSVPLQDNDRAKSDTQSSAVDHGGGPCRSTRPNDRHLQRYHWPRDCCTVVTTMRTRKNDNN